MLANQFGSFDDSGRVFTITDPNTPMPWANVVCNGRYGFVISQNGGGFSWLDNSQLNVLTRWEMDLARDVWGKHLYLSDLESGDIWSLAPSPCRPAYTAYGCSHEPGATTFRTEAHAIGAAWAMTVAPEHSAEVWLVTLTNNSSKPRKLRIASYMEWCCGVAPDTKREFHRLFFGVSRDAGRSAIVATKNMWDIPSKDEKKHWNQPWPYVAAHAVGGAKFDRELSIADKRAFLGRYGQPHSPAAMRGTLPSPEHGGAGFAGHGRFGDAVACLGGDLSLAPGQTVELVYVLAIGDDQRSVEKLIDQHRSVAAAKQTLQHARDAWTDRLTPSTIRCDAPDFSLLNSTWLAYQAISGRLWARTGMYQQSGAFGFRDQLQDSQVWLPRDPSQTRKQILLHAAHQFADGSVYHWWHPLAEFGLRTLCSDDYLWLPFLVANYIKDTGDWSLLAEHAAFVDDPKGASILDHCKRSIARSFARLSARGLPLIGSCDWNDGLSAMGVDGKGESVWLAQFLAIILDDFSRVLEHSGDAALAADYRDRRVSLVKAVEQHAWDGEWYRAATADDGRWLGTKTNSAGKIFLNTQTWAILSKAAPQDRERTAWESLKTHLLADMGPLLSAPAFTEPDAGIGYITRYAPGLRENGGVYMHAATWALAAACAMKDVKAVERIWRSISPPLRGQDAEHYVAEPYVTPGNVDGPLSITPGKAGWTWYTGSAAWLNRVSLEWLCGIRPVWLGSQGGDAGLLIEPCPPAFLGKVEASRLWRGRQVRVCFNANEYVAGHIPSITINGKAHTGNVLRPGDLDLAGAHARPGSEVLIGVSWGAARASGGGAGASGVEIKTVHTNGVAASDRIAAASRSKS